MRWAIACSMTVFAFSVTAWATAPAIVDPQDDLFQRSSKQPVPEQVEPRPSLQTIAPRQVGGQPAQIVAPKAAEPSLQNVAPIGTSQMGPDQPDALDRTQPPANPLWSIPLARLTATRDRPLFSASRRPRAAPVVKPPVAVAPPPAPVEREKPPLSLIGTALSSDGERLGLFVNTADKSIVRLKAGESYNGWVLRAVRARQVELGKGLDSALLDLPRPDLKENAMPVASGMAPMRVMPSIPNQTMTSVPAGGANSFAPGRAPGLAAALPAPPAGATITVRPPTFDAAPAAAPNPFRNERLP
uniref:hypothetical protein n=1 Tax=Bradyrhizobium sp. (strain ORS 278) TaxID=114615 RepID=UPI000681B719|nr:hypothetical protein [Bradyrhizobium sp. ORS 278]